jgi:hypothetical protein
VVAVEVTNLPVYLEALVVVVVQTLTLGVLEHRVRVMPAAQAPLQMLNHLEAVVAVVLVRLVLLVLLQAMVALVCLVQLLNRVFFTLAVEVVEETLLVEQEVTAAVVMVLPVLVVLPQVVL